MANRYRFSFHVLVLSATGVSAIAQPRMLLTPRGDNPSATASVFDFGGADCNGNGIPDECDIDCGPSGGPCDFPGCGMSEDCDGNGVADECEQLGWEQAAKLLADDGSHDDVFGWSVSVSGDVAVIGARWNDDNGSNSGSAYVFRLNGTAWVQEQRLLPDDGAASDHFGHSVSVSGDVALISARSHDDNGDDSGAAYLFRWNGAIWVQEQKLLPDDGSPSDRFGSSVFLSGDVALIGARWDDDNGTDSGSAYVFRWNGATWVQEAKLLSDDGEAGDSFGTSVSASGDLAVIGARLDDDNGIDSGSAYVFRWDGTTWAQEAKLLSEDGEPGDSFGNSVSVSGDLAAIGANRDDDYGSSSGSAYVFRWNGATWVQEQKLLPDDGYYFAEFGHSVSVSGDLVLIGAHGDNENGTYPGAAYVFRLNDIAWMQEQKLRANDGASFDAFGYSVSLSGEVAVIGAWGDGDNGELSGSAYVFDFGGPDCNDNGLPDECDIAEGTSQDENGNGIPDECDPCLGATDCDDGLFCNGSETCDAAYRCQAGDPVSCDDGVECTIDSCDTTNDVCVNAPDDAMCDNEFFCDGVEFCDALSGCQAGLAEDCDDAVDCTVDSCDVDNDVCVHTPDDDLCDDTMFCAPEICNPVLDCQVTDDPCVALGLACLESMDGCLCNDAADCDDGIGCTDDTCEGTPSSICMNTPSDANCDDGLFCNGAESCHPIDGCETGTLPCELDETCVEDTDRCEGDCNRNEIPDECDLDCGTAGGACDVPGCGMSDECNENGVPDECEELAWRQAAKLVADDGAAEDLFGISVSVSGDVAVIGTVWDDDNGTNSGSAYVFRWNGDTWVQEQRLLADDGTADDWFGLSVSVSGDVAVIGAPLDDDNGSNSGSAHVFRRNGATWVHEQKLLPNDGALHDNFGRSVSVSGDVAVIGAPGDDDNGNNSGSAYVFRWSGASWVQEQKILPDEESAGDRFGWSVSVSGDVTVVGAFGDNDNGTDSGSAWVFRWNGATWVPERKLLSDDGADGDWFGMSVSVSGDVAVIGARRNDDNGGSSGSAYVFRWNGATWVQQQKLLPDDGEPSDEFGFSVSVVGDLAVIGAYLDDDNGFDSGSAYVFRWNGATWVQEQKVLPDEGASADSFGVSVSVFGHRALIGAFLDDDNETDSGSVYVFDFASLDCNGTGILDECDIADGTSEDVNRNGIPDECEPAPILGDCDGDGDVDLFDYECFRDCVSGAGGGAAPGCEMFDFDGDGDVDLLDWRYFQIAFTGAP